MDEASKQELLEVINGPFPMTRLASLIERLIAEAEGRVHAQAIAAAAAEVLSVSWIPIHLRQDAIKLITRLTRPAAELRARIDVARARLTESEWWHQKLHTATGSYCDNLNTLMGCFKITGLRADLFDLETQLAALEGGK